MKSFNFPEMFDSTHAVIIEDKEATMSNLKLLLASWKTSLFGDPYFGTNLKRYIYSQNNTVLRDLVIDELYLSILTFMPQIDLRRKDISIIIKPNEPYAIYATVNCINKIDNQPNLFEIKLTE